MPETPSSKADGHLTDQLYWDSVHQGTALDPVPDAAPRKTAARTGIRRLIPPGLLERGRHSYAQEHFWRILLPRFVPRKPGASVLEIGVAPGDEVLQFHKCFDYEPFGIEFSPTGAQATRVNFAAHGIRASNVIEGDLFNNTLLAQFENRFDAVFSRGLIEHFTSPSDAIARHVRLAKPGGLVIISIPTLTGIHYLLTRVLMPHQIAIHNRAIMRLESFRPLFERSDLEPLFCGYQGGLNLLISYNPNPAGFRANLQWLAMKTQFLANLAARMGLMRGGYLNASLVFIGRKH